MLLTFVWSTCSAQVYFTKETIDYRYWGPEQVDNRIERDNSLADLSGFGFMYPYFDWKLSLNDRLGLNYGFDYSAAYLQGTDTLGWDNGAGGVARLYVSWDLVNRNAANKGALIFKVEHRHSYTELAPVDLAAELGYAGQFVPPFSSDGFQITNFYWRQRLFEGRLLFMAGLLDATDYVDVYALASPWTGFINFAFSTGSEAIYIPNEAALGFAIAGYATKNIYLKGSLIDAGADPAQPWKSFETFFTNNDYFKSIEVGYVSAPENFLYDNIHLTFWHSDGSVVTGAKSGWGLAFSGTWSLGEKWMPFLRGGYANDGGSLLQKSVTAGFGYKAKPTESTIGLALGWGEPNVSTFGRSLRDQFVFEFYYRAQLSSRLAITPDFQIVINPAYSSVSSLLIWGFRGRIAL
jgi:porin